MIKQHIIALINIVRIVASTVSKWDKIHSDLHNRMDAAHNANVVGFNICFANPIHENSNPRHRLAISTMAIIVETTMVEPRLCERKTHFLHTQFVFNFLHFALKNTSLTQLAQNTIDGFVQAHSSFCIIIFIHKIKNTNTIQKMSNYVAFRSASCHSSLWSASIKIIIQLVE